MMQIQDSIRKGNSRVHGNGCWFQKREKSATTFLGGWIYADEGQVQETEEWPEVEGLLGSQSHQKDRGSGVCSDSPVRMKRRTERDC